MAMAGKQKKNWSEIRHNGGCCCFRSAVYAPWACYMDIRALYTNKPPKCALTCQVDLAADQFPAISIANSILNANVHVNSGFSRACPLALPLLVNEFYNLIWITSQWASNFASRNAEGSFSFS